METVRVIGDIHGDFYEYEQILRDCNTPSIQVGDFGIGFGGPYWHDRTNEFHTETPQHTFIRGNHDDPQKCKTEMVGYIPDGSIKGEVMFIGGAWSIDNGHRTQGVNWWKDEECSYEEYQTFIDIYAQIKPKVMITHDAPLSVTKQMFIDHGKAFSKTQHKTLTGSALEVMFEIHQPEIWMFGHWHHTEQMTINGTNFQCVGENDFIDVDLPL